MSAERFFLDTAYVLALLNQRDQYHAQAVALLPRVQSAKEVLVTEAILTELGNALSVIDRPAAVQFINQCYQTSNIRVVPVEASLFQRALALYRARPDKEWGLTDCVSFVVMNEEHVSNALTANQTFHAGGVSACHDGLAPQPALGSTSSYRHLYSTGHQHYAHVVFFAIVGEGYFAAWGRCAVKLY